MQTLSTDPSREVLSQVLLGDRHEMGVARDFLSEVQSRDPLAPEMRILFREDFGRANCPGSGDLQNLGANLVCGIFPALQGGLAQSGLQEAAVTVGADRRAFVTYQPTWTDTPITVPLTMLGGAHVTAERIGDADRVLHDLRGSMGRWHQEQFEQLIAALPPTATLQDLRTVTTRIALWVDSAGLDPHETGLMVQSLLPSIGALAGEPNGMPLIVALLDRAPSFTSFEAMIAAADQPGARIGSTWSLREKVLPVAIETQKGRLSTALLDELITTTLDAAGQVATTGLDISTSGLIEGLRALGRNATAADIPELARFALRHQQIYATEPQRLSDLASPVAPESVNRLLNGLAGENVTIDTIDASYRAIERLALVRRKGWNGTSALAAALTANARNRTPDGIADLVSAITSFEDHTSFMDHTSQHTSNKAGFLSGMLRHMGAHATPKGIAALETTYRHLCDARVRSGNEGYVRDFTTGILGYNQSRYLTPGTIRVLQEISAGCVSHVSDGLNMSHTVNTTLLHPVAATLSPSTESRQVRELFPVIKECVDEFSRLDSRQRKAFQHLLDTALGELQPHTGRLDHLRNIVAGCTALMQEARRGIGLTDEPHGEAKQILRAGLERPSLEHDPMGLWAFTTFTTNSTPVETAAHVIAAEATLAF